MLLGTLGAKWLNCQARNDCAEAHFIFCIWGARKVLEIGYLIQPVGVIMRQLVVCLGMTSIRGFAL